MPTLITMKLEQTCESLGPWFDLAGRILIVGIFILTAPDKITDFAGTQEWMESKGVSGILLPAVIALEILGSLSIILGWKTRISAFLLAGFTLLTAFLFYPDLSNEGQFLHFMKNLGIAGGFMFLVANGSGRYSLDARSA